MRTNARGKDLEFRHVPFDTHTVLANAGRSLHQNSQLFCALLPGPQRTIQDFLYTQCKKVANGSPPPAAGDSKSVKLPATFQMVSAMFQDSHGGTLGDVNFDPIKRTWTWIVTSRDHGKMCKLFGDHYMSVTIPDGKRGGGEQGKMFYPLYFDYCHNSPEVLNLSSDLILIINRTRSGWDFHRTDTDDIDQIPWAQVQGVWSFHGRRGFEIMSVHGTDLRLDVGHERASPVPEEDME